mmetsp:Transcript_34944/g.80477  ORF Transcript_34944/g.80477 Transcript_34944/m.80477 type:complete len:163 (+) Transcript_34944:192-680(+)
MCQTGRSYRTTKGQESLQIMHATLGGLIQSSLTTLNNRRTTTKPLTSSLQEEATAQDGWQRFAQEHWEPLTSFTTGANVSLTPARPTRETCSVDSGQTTEPSPTTSVSKVKTCPSQLKVKETGPGSAELQENTTCLPEPGCSWPTMLRLAPETISPRHLEKP